MISKITEITIIIKDGSTVTTLTRNEQYVWTINGYLFPRHLKFINQLNELARECDGNIEGNK